MPNAQSVIVVAKTMMTSVSKSLQTILDSAQEHLGHIEERYSDIQVHLAGSDHPKVPQLFAAQEAAIEALKKCITAIRDQPKNAAEIESRL